MTETKLLLINIAEEAAEVAVEAAKAVRYTSKPRQVIGAPNKIKDHGLNLVTEFTQLAGLVEELQRRGVLPTLKEPQLTELKIGKVRRALEHSKHHSREI